MSGCSVMREQYDKSGQVPTELFLGELNRVDVEVGVYVVFGSAEARPYSLDHQGRRWLLDGSGDVA